MLASEKLDLIYIHRKYYVLFSETQILSVTDMDAIQLLGGNLNFTDMSSDAIHMLEDSLNFTADSRSSSPLTVSTLLSLCIHIFCCRCIHISQQNE